MKKHKPLNRIAKTDEELFKSFSEQVDFLTSAAESYDSGYRSRIKMAMPAMRTLFYKQGDSDPLVKRISSLPLNHFISTTWNKGNEYLYTGPVFISKVISGTYRYFPNCYEPNMQPEKKEPFDAWWSDIIMAANGESFSRWEIIKFLANQDGGSHVDDGLEAKYYRMVHNKFSPQIRDGAFNGYASEYNLALARQLVHEAIISIKHMHVLKINYNNGQNSSNSRQRVSEGPFQLMQSSFTWL